MNTIYRACRCYGPPAGHYGWLFKANGAWFAGSLEMPASTAPNWLLCKGEFATLDEATEWFRRGGPAEGSHEAPAPYCALDRWDLDGPVDLDAGVEAHRNAGVGTINTTDNTCWHEAMRVLEAVAARSLEGEFPDRREHLAPKPDDCSKTCLAL